MFHGTLKLCEMKGQWRWYYIDFNGYSVCNSVIGFKTCGQALDNIVRQAEDHLAMMSCRNC